MPFLFLMTLAAIGQVDAARIRTMARTLGYGPIAAWLKTVFPQVYPQIRLPVFAVLAYAVSVVDVAIVLAPTTPPPLAVQLVRWFNDPELAMRFVASAGAIAATRHRRRRDVDLVARRAGFDLPGPDVDSCRLALAPRCVAAPRRRGRPGRRIRRRFLEPAQHGLVVARRTLALSRGAARTV